MLSAISDRLFNSLNYYPISPEATDRTCIVCDLTDNDGTEPIYAHTHPKNRNELIHPICASCAEKEFKIRNFCPYRCKVNVRSILPTPFSTYLSSIALISIGILFGADAVQRAFRPRLWDYLPTQHYLSAAGRVASLISLPFGAYAAHLATNNGQGHRWLNLMGVSYVGILCGAAASMISAADTVWSAMLLNKVPLGSYQELGSSAFAVSALTGLVLICQEMVDLYQGHDVGVILQDPNGEEVPLQSHNSHKVARALIGVFVGAVAGMVTGDVFNYAIGKG